MRPAPAFHPRGFLAGLVVGLALLFGGYEAVWAAAPAPIDQSGWNARKQMAPLAGGPRIAWVELGDPAGAPLVLVHGFTDTSRSWSIVAPWLAGRRLIVPDLRGHGGSEAPDCCYAPGDFAADLVRLLDHLGIARADFAGHSLGSMTVLHLAAEHPSRVGRIALVGSTGLVPIRRGDWLWEGVHSLRAPLDASAPFLLEWHPANQPTPVDPAFAEAAMTEILAVEPRIWRAVVRELAELPVARHAADVTAPTLILSGGRDPLFPPEHHAALAAALPHAQAEVLAALGHNPIWERPETVGPILAAFFAAAPLQGD